MDEPRIVGPTLMVPTGGNAVATIPLPGCDPHLEWSLRYGNPEAVRFSAASVVETFEYLLSDNINMTEATRRLRVMRAAVREHVAGVQPCRLPQQLEALIEEAVDAFAEGNTLGDRLPNAMAALRDALADGVAEALAPADKLAEFRARTPSVRRDDMPGGAA